MGERDERIPLTLFRWDNTSGTVTIVFKEVGFSTRKLGSLKVGDEVLNIAGPLGNPSSIEKHGAVVVVGGGVGTAAVFPIAKALKEIGVHITAIIGAKTKNLIILEDEMKEASDELYVSTDDGSKGTKGFVSQVLNMLIERGCRFRIVYAIGPPLMMKAVSDVTRPHGIRTIVSLNPIMVDGMGMCGTCRVSVGGKTKFACVDGPEFDAHEVDFDELNHRMKTYLQEERRKACTGHPQ